MVCVGDLAVRGELADGQLCRTLLRALGLDRGLVVKDWLDVMGVLLLCSYYLVGLLGGILLVARAQVRFRVPDRALLGRGLALLLDRAVRVFQLGVRENFVFL